MSDVQERRVMLNRFLHGPGFRKGGATRRHGARNVMREDHSDAEQTLS
jgi:hypothetical protein